MELKDFIKNTITSICEAIIESQTELTDKGALINPDKTKNKSGGFVLDTGGSKYL